MRVIKDNTIEKWSFMFMCSNCGSELEAEKSDIKTTKSCRNEFDYNYVTCSICKKDHEILGRRMPKTFQK